VIGDRSIFGPYTMIHTANHEMETHTPIPDQGWEPRLVTIGADVWVGMGVSILPGVTIGEGAVIGAGSVVVRDIEPYGIAVGNPAKVVRNRRG
jgi:maltose O-acetyltransferase